MPSNQLCFDTTAIFPTWLGEYIIALFFSGEGGVGRVEWMEGWGRDAPQSVHSPADERPVTVLFFAR